jgi:hypothetical protein
LANIRQENVLLEDFFMKYKLMLLIICLLILVPACAPNDNGADDNIPDKEEEEYGKYSHNGRIVKVDKGGFHVESDEKVEFFNVDEGARDNFYVGEYVRLNSKDGDIYDVALDEEFDYTAVMKADMFDEDERLDLRVEKISRDETGTMRIMGLAADNKEYDIITGPETVTNFAYSRLKTGDEIIVYPENISGGTTARVEAKAVLKDMTD